MADFDPEKDFEFIERLGKGQFGEVWKVKHKLNGRLLAAKKVSVTSESHVTDLTREISAMKKCVSPYVVKFYGSLLKDKIMWIVMEYCPVGSINDVMLMTRLTLSEEQIATVCKNALAGLDCVAQNKKIHRDIKPHNILLTSKGDAKLADFGIARDMDDNGGKRKTVIGTPYYLAPEVIKEAGYDSRADVWALGISAIEMAEKDPPYGDLHPMRVLFLVANNPPPKLTNTEHWSSEFNDFIACCLDLDPDRRRRPGQLLSARHLTTYPPVIEQAGGLENAIQMAKPVEPKEDNIESSNDDRDLEFGSDASRSGGSFDMDFDGVKKQKFFDDTDSEFESDSMSSVGSEDDVSQDIDDILGDLIADDGPKKSLAPVKRAESKKPPKNLARKLSEQKLAAVKEKDEIDWDSLVEGLVADKETSKIRPVDNKPQSGSNSSASTPRGPTEKLGDLGFDWDSLLDDPAPAEQPQAAPPPQSESAKPEVPGQKQIDWATVMKDLEQELASATDTKSNELTVKPVGRPTSKHLDDLLEEIDTMKVSSTDKRQFKNVAALAFKKAFPAAQTVSSKGKWVGVVTGPNPFRNNPQFAVTVQEAVQVLITVKPLRRNVRVGFSVVRVRDIQHKMPTLPSYGIHLDVPYSSDPEISMPTFLSDAAFKYVIIPTLESIELSQTCDFELSIAVSLPQSNLSIAAVPNMATVTRDGDWTAQTAGGCLNFSSWRLNPQFALKVHIQTDLHIYVSQHTLQLQHIGMYVAKADDPSAKLVRLSKAKLINTDTRFRKRTEVYSGRLSLLPGTYVIIPAIYEPGKRGSFTLSVSSPDQAYASAKKFDMEPIADARALSVNGAWIPETAGGCMNFPSWIRNPKFHMTVHGKTNLSISVASRTAAAATTTSETSQPKLGRTSSKQGERPFLGFYVFKGDANKASSVTRTDVVLKTRQFQDLTDVLETVTMPPGHYIIMPCTYHPGVSGEFSVNVFVSDNTEVTLNALTIQNSQIRGAWGDTSAGGGFNHSSWRINPQYLLTALENGDVSVSLSQSVPAAGEMPVIGVAIARPAPQNFTGQKLMQLSPQEILQITKFQNSSVVSTQSLPMKKGEAVVILPMAFEPGVKNNFEINVAGSSKSLKLIQLPESLKHASQSGQWSRAAQTVGGCMNNKNTWQLNPKFRFGVRQKASVKLFLSQDPPQTPPGAPKLLPTAAGFYLFKFTPGGALTRDTFIGKSEFLPKREVLAEFDVEPGVYMVIPTKFNQGEEGQFSVHVYSTQEVIMAPMATGK